MGCIARQQPLKRKFVVILTKFSSLTALEVVFSTTSSAAIDGNFVKLTTFSFQCAYLLGCIAKQQRNPALNACPMRIIWHVCPGEIGRRLRKSQNKHNWKNVYLVTFLIYVFSLFWGNHNRISYQGSALWFLRDDMTASSHGNTVHIAGRLYHPSPSGSRI